MRDFMIYDKSKTNGQQQQTNDYLKSNLFYVSEIIAQVLLL